MPALPVLIMWNATSRHAQHIRVSAQFWCCRHAAQLRCTSPACIIITWQMGNVNVVVLLARCPSVQLLQLMQRPQHQLLPAISNHRIMCIIEHTMAKQKAAFEMSDFTACRRHGGIAIHCTPKIQYQHGSYLCYPRLGQPASSLCGMQ